MESKGVYTSHVQINHSAKDTNNNQGESIAVGFEPYEGDNSTSGNLYILFEHNSADKKINFEHLIKVCGESFYEKSPDSPIASRFKACLKSINEVLKKNSAVCNIAIVSIEGDQILFSNVGRSTMLHIRKDSATNLSTKEVHNSFKEIGQGKIKSADKILLAGQSILHGINKKDLTIMAAKQSPEDFSDHLELALRVNDLSYSALLVTASDSPTKQYDEEPPKKDKRPVISDAKFKALMLSIKKSIKDGGAKAKNKASQLKVKEVNNIGKEITTKTKSIWTTFWSKYINPNPKQAIIIVISTILIIIGIFWSSSLFSGKPKSAVQLEKAEVLITNAKSSLSKNNQASAQESATKARELLDSISQTDQKKLDELAKNKRIQNGYSSTLESLTYVNDKLSSTIRVTNQNAFSMPQSSLKSLVWLNGSLYGLSSNDGAIIEINPLLGQPTTKASSADLKESISMESFSDSGLIILTKSGLIQYTQDKGLQKINSSSLPASNDIASYLNNIYLLSSSESQVIRYTKSGLNLSGKTPLLKNVSSSELSKATSLAVNGNVFVASENKLLLFEQGSERAYKINNLPSGFGNIKDIYFNKDGGYFVMLNSSSNRLALLSTGSESADFIKQYALESDSKIDSFTVEPKNSQILINSGNKIYTNKIEK